MDCEDWQSVDDQDGVGDKTEKDVPKVEESTAATETQVKQKNEGSVAGPSNWKKGKPEREKGRMRGIPELKHQLMKSTSLWPMNLRRHATRAVDCEDGQSEDDQDEVGDKTEKDEPKVEESTAATETQEKTKG